ncbi:MAG TPA: HNH endonuclease [Advenella kashmirensis]|uniref:HNH endonuclease n=1 Tax=Advenella kashmirensis TaxID=310575 RepID=A0A356LAF5_9BURK|nr:HNH endonuclease [Advenella kashmirensis]
MGWKDDKRTSTQRGYGYKWQQARAAYLADHPLCVMCRRQARVTKATVVDHIKPHKLADARESGNQKQIEKAEHLFWSQENWQALCKRHHDSDKQMLEKTGRERLTIGPDGYPVEGEG